MQNCATNRATTNIGRSATAATYVTTKTPLGDTLRLKPPEWTTLRAKAPLSQGYFGIETIRYEDIERCSRTSRGGRESPPQTSVARSHLGSYFNRPTHSRPGAQRASRTSLSGI